jgi:hypothetical protein
MLVHTACVCVSMSFEVSIAGRCRLEKIIYLALNHAPLTHKTKTHSHSFDPQDKNTPTLICGNFKWCVVAEKDISFFFFCANGGLYQAKYAPDLAS